MSLTIITNESDLLNTKPDLNLTYIKNIKRSSDDFMKESST